MNSKPSTAMTEHRQFSAQRMFVLKLFAESTSADEQTRTPTIAGQVEHVPSNQSAQFQSMQELEAFIERVLDTTPSE